jgi:RNA polymerase sigma-B factor
VACRSAGRWIRDAAGIRDPPTSGDHVQQTTGARTRTVLEDLDAIAERFADAWERCPAPRRARLREEMIRSALPFAARLAGRYRNRGEPADDLEQVARLGLVKAVDRYAPDRGSFTAFAVTTITGELKRHFRDRTWAVHVPRRMQDLGLEVTQATALLRHQRGRTPTDAELAAHCDVDEEDIAAARLSAACYRSASLNTPVGDGSAELGDLYGGPDPDVGLVEDRLTVRKLIERMPARERRLLALRFYGNLSQSEIAAELGMSQMHVSRLLSRALAGLREAMLTDSVPRRRAEEDETRLDIVSQVIAGGGVRLRVAGEIDRDNAHELSDAALGTVCRVARRQTVVLDLAGVPFVDAAGVAALVAVHEAARVREVTVTVTGLQPHVRTIVAVSGLRALLGPADDR